MKLLLFVLVAYIASSTKSIRNGQVAEYDKGNRQHLSPQKNKVRHKIEFSLKQKSQNGKDMDDKEPTNKKKKNKLKKKKSGKGKRGNTGSKKKKKRNKNKNKKVTSRTKNIPGIMRQDEPPTTFNVSLTKGPYGYMHPDEIDVSSPPHPPSPVPSGRRPSTGALSARTP